jgi:2-(1,2-epoxy-1,2-dihydrophenyl)acetyl-CoA isomerase
MTGDAGIEELVRAVYAALATGDREALEALLHPEAEGTLTEGLPLGIGGVRRGPEAMIRDGWWAIGAAYAMRARPAEWIPCADGRLLVLGRYVGTARSSGSAVDAAYAHLWTARDGSISSVWQLTDSALWRDAL